MSDPTNGPLRQTVRDLAEKCRRLRTQYQDRGLGEENTKASLINPMLKALGWAIDDPDEVYHEFRPTPKDNPVDYCLRLVRNPRLLIEAKGLGEDLSDRRWVAQILGYATMAGAEWCVLTNGDEYALYNASAAVDADGKLFCRVRLTESPEEECAWVMGLISRANMEENFLSQLWNTHFVDRRVKQTLLSLLDPVSPRLVKLVRKHLPDLSPKEIAESVRRLDIRVESASALAVPPPRRATGRGRPARKKGKKAGRSDFGVTLPDLLAGGYLRAPLALFRKYKGQRMEATLLPDGRVEFQGTVYDSSSTAADYARGTLTGRRMNTNGWIFWQYLDESQKTVMLDDARQRFIRSKTAQ
jgi:hypothetical protein